MTTRPESMMVDGGPKEIKRRAIVEAQSAQSALDRWFKKNESPYAGKYHFKELIGKGSYGRVYKSVQNSTGRLVAIKVLTPDDADLNIPAEARDTNLVDAIKEINILERLKQSGATNVNELVEAFTVHSQLWLVSDYCSGGSLSTLKRAAGGKLEEKYIRAIARELALGLASVHQAGIVHRDIKCANVMVSESGGIQIIDFGVSAVLMSNMEEDKRKTIIGTPHWMAPELQHAPEKEVLHGSEVDVWAFGITLYECAMGYPPNATVTQQARLRNLLRQQPPRLTDDKFSAELRDLVKYVLDPDPKARPSMQDVCNHPYLEGSATGFPTSSLKDLVEIYFNWERGGGNRASLWYAGGAAQANFHQKPEQDEWVFSTTAAFDRMHGEAEDDGFDMSNSPPREADEWDEDPSISRTLRPDGEIMDVGSRMLQDAEARRGEKHLEGLFNQSATPYTFGKTVSDLPLRSGDSGSSLHRKELSVSSNDDGTPNIDLGAIDSKKASKRATMAWKWDDNKPKTKPGETAFKQPSVQAQDNYSLGDPVTARSANVRDTLDLDAMMGGGSSSTARQSIRKTLDMDALMGGGASRNSVRKTLDMDALMGGGASRNSVRKTLDMDALMGAGPPQRNSARQTLDLDALMGDMGMPSVPPVPPVPQNLPSHSQQPSFQDPRKTLDLDALMGNMAPSMPPNMSLGDPFSYNAASAHEQTMRPVSQHHAQALNNIQGHDFASAPPQNEYSYNDFQPSHSRGPSSQTRPMTFDIDSFIANGTDLDAVMAGDHDYTPSSSSIRGPMTDDDSSIASNGLSSANASAIHSRNQSGSVGVGLASSPPTSPFQMIPDQAVVQHHSAMELPPVPDYPAPVGVDALRDGVNKSVTAGEMKRLLAHFSGVLDVALAYLNEAERRAPPPSTTTVANGNGMGAEDDADTESIHGSVHEFESRDGTPVEDEGLEMRHR